MLGEVLFVVGTVFVMTMVLDGEGFVLGLIASLALVIAVNLDKKESEETEPEETHIELNCDEWCQQEKQT